MTPDDRLLAAEWVIGLLSPTESAAVEARCAQDAAFAAEVDWWEARLAPLLAHYREVPPPPHLAERIEALLTLPSVPVRAGRVHWRSLAIGATGGAIAASFAAWLLVPVAVPPPAPPVAVPARPVGLMIAQLAWTEPLKVPAPVAIVEPATGSVRLTRGVDTPAGRDGQLWRIPAGGKPVSLGLLPRGDTRAVRVAQANLPSAGSTLAISIEPRGGSPTGQPTGPVVAAGTIEQW
ncbi:anti-sigma factor [Sphingomonas sp. 8AM]|uniref:anti-sigma factor n=1 Tax=Sphingomonas sp. 8AM TaxID=2653170 RepID=UPI0012F11A19|nr:anti-sigma factor [Sphingomonas sp. 8AM]VXC69207.1 Anti-sigma-K factor RskA [Sphingomonas sp. 8AM]